MNDPWDVKSVLRLGQYVSCMKINGVPLLPPVLSKECREEMRYYKLLAIETEKRISLLSTLSCDSDSECSDKTLYDKSQDKVEDTSVKSNLDNTQNTSIGNDTCDQGESTELMNYDLDSDAKSPTKSPDKSDSIMDVPERDSGWSPIADGDNNNNDDPPLIEEVKVPPAYTPLLSDEGKQSQKSFTGSLDNIHVQSKQTIPEVRLIRQSSYTVLTPSPQLLAHLEVQSYCNGVDMTSVSISGSLSNLSCKKRRNWDLETAKEKWSNMADELNKNTKSRTLVAKQRSPIVRKDERMKSYYVSDRRKTYPISVPRTPFKNMNTNKSSPGVIKSVTNNNKENGRVNCKKENRPASSAGNLCNDNTEYPVLKVRELYEKMQKEQMMQMSNLIERQKHEQEMLHQAFEEQNNIFYKQLKIICPKTSMEVKEAWQEEDRGPVSLSQLINLKQNDATLDVTNHFLNASQQMLKKSRHITNSLNKDANIINIRAKSTANIPERDSSTSEKDFDDQMLTNRTNDTLADLNFTLTDDSGTEYSNTCIHNVSKTPSGKSRGSMSCRSEGRKVNMKLFEAQLPTPQERAAATTIVAYAKGYLVRRLLETERVCEIVQTIRDALLCALQLHQDKEGIKGADVDLHRRLIQQITAACYNLHDTFINSTPEERCAMIAADRAKKRALEIKQFNFPRRLVRPTDIMSQSHSGAFPAREKRRPIPNTLTQSTYETYNSEQRKTSNARPPPWR